MDQFPYMVEALWEEKSPPYQPTHNFVWKWYSTKENLSLSMEKAIVVCFCH